MTMNLIAVSLLTALLAAEPNPLQHIVVTDTAELAAPTESRTTTPLFHAVENCDLAETQRVLDMGTPVNQKNTMGETPLHKAISCPKDLAVLLIKYKADVNAKDLQDLTPLHLASSIGMATPLDGTVVNTAIASLLIQKGAKVDARDKELRTPLSIAASNGDTDIIRLLLKNGADANIKDSNGKTPLYRAAESHQTSAANLLRPHTKLP